MPKYSSAICHLSRRQLYYFSEQNRSRSISSLRTFLRYLIKFKTNETIRDASSRDGTFSKIKKIRFLGHTGYVGMALQCLQVKPRCSILPSTFGRVLCRDAPIKATQSLSVPTHSLHLHPTLKVGIVRQENKIVDVSEAVERKSRAYPVEGTGNRRLGGHG